MKQLTIKRLKGKEVLPYIPELAKLRIEVFRDYPYLYEGKLEYESHYLQTYVNCPESVMVLVFDNHQVVGISTSIPMEFETIEFQKPFLDHAIPVQDIFYLGESVLLPAYRGQGVYKHFFQERESAARQYGCKIAAFAAIERPDNHPAKPDHYTPLNAVWKRFGYEKHSELCMHYKWKDLYEDTPSDKPLIFWMKQL